MSSETLHDAREQAAHDADASLRHDGRAPRARTTSGQRDGSGVWLGSLALLLVLCSLLYLFRNAVATSLTGLWLARQSAVNCSRPELRVARALDGLTVTNIDCAVRTGPISQALFEGETVLDLSGLSLSRVRLANGMVDQRERDVSGAQGDTLFEIADAVGLTDSLVKGMLDASESYADDGPTISAAQLEVRRAGKRQAVMHDFSKRQVGEWNRLHAETVDIGTKLVSLRHFDLQVTKHSGRLRVDVYLGEPKGSDAPALKIRLEGEHLDSKTPRFEMAQ